MFQIMFVFQVLGLLVEVMKKGFQKHINSVLPVVRIILKSSVNVVRDRELDTSTEATIPFWKEAYYSLVLLEKILIQFREPCLGIEIEVNHYIILFSFHSV